jgi:hypothetical protein
MQLGWLYITLNSYFLNPYFVVKLQLTLNFLIMIG